MTKERIACFFLYEQNLNFVHCQDYFIHDFNMRIFEGMNLHFQYQNIVRKSIRERKSFGRLWACWDSHWIKNQSTFNFIPYWNNWNIIRTGVSSVSLKKIFSILLFAIAIIILCLLFFNIIDAISYKGFMPLFSFSMYIVWHSRRDEIIIRVKISEWIDEFRAECYSWYIFEDLSVK